MSLATALFGRVRAASRTPEMVDVVLPTLLVRLVLIAFGLVALRVTGASPPLESWLAIWNRWDGPHYIEIAARGYDPTGDTALIAFFPLYPALIRIVSVVLPPLPAAMLISLAATLLAAIGLYRLVLTDGGREVARRAVLFLNIFPTSFALVAPYSEPLFLALTIWSLLLARRGDWVGASVLGLLAATARIQGALLLAVLAVEYLATHRRLGRQILWTALVAVGPLAYLALNQLAYGDPFFFVEVQREHFYHRLEAPWVVVDDLVRNVASRGWDQEWATIYLAPLVAIVVMGLVVAWSFVSRRSRPSYAAYALLSLGLLASLTWPISAPRYVLAVFPVLIALADVTGRYPVRAALAALSCLLLAIFTTIFVSGGWAF